MGKQIAFYEKNFFDLDNESATVTTSEANEFSRYMRTRSLRNAWLTTDSVDADNTEIDIDLSDTYLIDRMIFADFNFKSFKIELYDFEGGTWSEIYSTTDNMKETLEVEFEEFYGRRLRVTVYGTQVADQDKRLNRLLITKFIGRFEHWPKIENPTLDQGKIIRKVLSGKNAILRTAGAFQCRLSIEHWRNANDLALIERLYRQVQGFQVWLNGGDETQFYYPAESYRDEDIYLVGIANDWKPKIKEGIYPNGLDVQIDLVEAVR